MAERAALACIGSMKARAMHSLFDSRSVLFRLDSTGCLIQLKLSPVLLLLMYHAFSETFITNVTPIPLRYQQPYMLRFRHRRLQIILFRLRGGRNFTVHQKKPSADSRKSDSSHEDQSEPQLFGHTNEETQDSNMTFDETHLQDDSEPSETLQEFVIRVRRMANPAGTQQSTGTDPDSEGSDASHRNRLLHNLGA